MAITKKNRREFIEDMFFKLENVPIEQIVGSRVPLKQQGAHLYGSCPFHSSTHHRSFVVTPRKISGIVLYVVMDLEAMG